MGAGNGYLQSLTEQKGVIIVDILHLIDRLEEEIDHGRRLPFTSTVVINEQRLWDIIDSMRISIPEEVERAQQVERERERILAQAREEAERIVALAREQAEELTSSHELMQNAQAEAEQIIARARSEAERFQREAESYALGVLKQLEEQLTRELQTVRNGIRLLQQGEESSSDEEP